MKEELLQIFSDADIIIYGSKARGEDEGLSDIDFLILLESQINRKLREGITEITYNIELNILNN